MDFIETQELKSSFRSAYCFDEKLNNNETWIETETMFMNDPIEKNIIEALVSQFQRGIMIREPIYLKFDENDTGFVANGTHRVIAASIAGLHEIPIQHETNKTFDSTLHYFSTEFTVPCHVTDSEFEEFFIDFSDNMRSIPLNDHEWITADFISSANSVIEVNWDTKNIDIILKGTKKIIEFTSKYFIVTTGFHIYEEKYNENDELIFKKKVKIF